VSETIRVSVAVAKQERNDVELSLVAAVAAADTIERAVGLAVEIKWPGDLMLRRMRVGSATSDATGLTVEIRVDQTREELPAGSGSLALATGRAFAAEPLFVELHDHLDRCLSEWRAGGLEALYPRLGARDFLRGRRVRVDGKTGTALMIDRHGRLQIHADDGERLVVDRGEVTYER
jgi:BirA family biotin operon repressor/biotin-[acetyl-CoA-carboxylase] ligase